MDRVECCRLAIEANPSFYRLTHYGTGMTPERAALYVAARSGTTSFPSPIAVVGFFVVAG